MNGEKKYEHYGWKYRQEDFKFCPRCGASLKLQDLHIADQPQLVCDACRFIFYLDPKVVVAAVVLHRGKVLLLKRAEEPGKGKWGLPGGYVTRGENIIAAVANEVLEEAGLDFANKGILECLDLPEGQGLQIIFWGEADSPSPRPNIESTEAEFFAPHSIPWGDLAFDSTAAALKRMYGTFTQRPSEGIR